jgi:hypothetical protein
MTRKSGALKSKTFPSSIEYISTPLSEDRIVLDKKAFLRDLKTCIFDAMIGDFTEGEVVEFDDVTGLLEKNTLEGKGGLSESAG